MKAISLWEPWASLIRTGAKTIETRSWYTDYRGRLLICAAKQGLPKAELLRYLSSCYFQGALAPLIGKPLVLDGSCWPGVYPRHLNFGRAVAIVELWDCIPVEKLTLENIGANKHFGDFTPGRYAWILNPLFYAFPPFPVKGHQGFFDVLDEIIDYYLNLPHTNSVYQA